MSFSNNSRYSMELLFFAVLSELSKDIVLLAHHLKKKCYSSRLTTGFVPYFFVILCTLLFLMYWENLGLGVRRLKPQLQEHGYQAVWPLGGHEISWDLGLLACKTSIWAGALWSCSQISDTTESPPFTPCWPVRWVLSSLRLLISLIHNGARKFILANICRGGHHEKCPFRVHMC